MLKQTGGWFKRIGDFTSRTGSDWTDGLQSGLSQLTGLIYPPECAMCEAKVPLGHRLCRICENQLAANRYCCQRCSAPLPNVVPNDDCLHCRKSHWKFSRVIALGPYRGKLKEAVVLCKQFHSDGLRHALALHLVERIRQRIPQIDEQNPLLIPIPYHWTRAAARRVPTAFNLTDVLSRSSGWPMSARMVQRIRWTKKQAMVSYSERKKNVRGAFSIARSQVLEGRHVLIVDDVLTSGSTADELARQIKLAKPSGLSVVVIARATGQ